MMTTNISADYIFPDPHLCRTKIADYGNYQAFTCLTGMAQCAYHINSDGLLFCIHPERRDFLEPGGEGSS